LEKSVSFLISKSFYHSSYQEAYKETYLNKNIAIQPLYKILDHFSWNSKHLHPTREYLLKRFIFRYLPQFLRKYFL
jgi:hypothetical protein